MTIQMKALFLYLHMVLFVFQNEMWEFGRNLLSAKFGSERVRYRTLPTGVLSLHANRPRGPDFFLALNLLLPASFSTYATYK